MWQVPCHAPSVHFPMMISSWMSGLSCRIIRVIRPNSVRPVGIYSIPRGITEVQVEAFEGILDGMPVYFINGDPIQASGSVYSSNNKLDGEKYAFFSLAALELPRQLNWNPDIIHANDWHTALASYGNLVKRWDEKTRHISSIVTIHNLPFLGPDVSAILQEYGLPLANTDLPVWARVMPMPLGLWASDAIVAVSPTYAHEILQEEFGMWAAGFPAEPEGYSLRDIERAGHQLLRPANGLYARRQFQR